jgi:hypothetical protein
MRKISGWRLRRNNFNFPLEQKLFHAFVRLSGQKMQAESGSTDQTSGVTPNAPA